MDIIAAITSVTAGATISLVLIAASWMCSGHWLPVRSNHIPLNFTTLTIADIPVEELGLDPAEIDREQWHMAKYTLGAYWRLGLLAGAPRNPFSVTGL